METMTMHGRRNRAKPAGRRDMSRAIAGRREHQAAREAAAMERRTAAARLAEDKMARHDADPDVQRCRDERARRRTAFLASPELAEAKAAFAKAMEDRAAKHKGGRPAKPATSPRGSGGRFRASDPRDALINALGAFGGLS